MMILGRSTIEHVRFRREYEYGLLTIADGLAVGKVLCRTIETCILLIEMDPLDDV